VELEFCENVRHRNVFHSAINVFPQISILNKSTHLLECCRKHGDPSILVLVLMERASFAKERSFVDRVRLSLFSLLVQYY
jgi:hypothetical protein